MTPLTAAYALGALGMLTGVGICAQLFSVTDASDDGAFRYLLIIPGAAAVMYTLMALDVGTLIIDGTPVPSLRYVDWLLTTPVLVGYVAYTAGAPRRVIATVVGIDAAMIALGVVAVVTDGAVRYGAFTASSVCYLGLLWILYGYLPSFATTVNTERRRLYELLRNHVGLLWLIYPVVWIAGPLGVGAVSTLAVSLIITYIDVIAKVPYVYFVYQHRGAFTSLPAASSAAADAERTPTPAD